MNLLQKIFYGLALLFIPLAIILDKIGGVPQPLLFFLAAVAIFPLVALLVQPSWCPWRSCTKKKNREDFKLKER